MKKSLANIAISVAITSAVLSTTALSTQAYASEYIPADDDNSNSKTTETYMLPGMSVGAATGAIVAGPVGLLVGGFIGAVVGANNEVNQETGTSTTDETVSSASQAMLSDSEVQNTATDISDTENSIQLAQLGPVNTTVDEQSENPQEELMNILVTDLSLDVYFRSGSTDVEKFYPARLSAIADLINTMDELELHLDGYTDRRGNQLENIKLANERVEKVRQQLVDAGVDNDRIISKAFGEIKMVSEAGDLDAYTFDRKVVIRFERAGHNSIYAMTSALSDKENEQTEISVNEKDINPIAVDVISRF